MAKKNNNRKQPWSIPLRERETLYNGINPSADFGIGSFLSQGIGYLGGFRTGQGMNEDEARWAAYLGLPYNKEYAPDTNIRFEQDKNYPDRQYQGLSKRAKNEIRKDVIPEAKRIKDKYNKEWIQVLDERGTFGNDSTIYHPRETYTGDLGKFGIREVGNSGIYEVGDKYDFPSWIPVPDRNEGTELMIRDTIWSDRANPKLYNKEIIKRKNNKYLFGGLKDMAKDAFSKDNILGGLKSGAGAIGSLVGQGAHSLISGGLSSGAGNAITGVTGTIGGALSKVNPVLGGAVSAIGGAVGGLVNKAFGSKLNQEKIAGVEGDISQAMNFISNAGDYDALASNYANIQGVQGFNRASIGKDGWFSNKAKKKYNALKTQAEEAEEFQLNTLENNALNIANATQQNLLANYSAYGGPISGALDYEYYNNIINNDRLGILGDMKFTSLPNSFSNEMKELQTFADGGKIHIKPSKRGTFTTAAKKRGMGVQEFASKVLANKEDYSPAMVKKANFARNASKWKHADGGPLDTRMKFLRRLEEKRRRRDNYGGGEFGGAGASSLFLNSPDEYVLEKDTIYLPYRETFNDAFGRARAAGLDEFMFDNKLYTTELGDNPDNNRAGEERVVEGIIPIERTVKKKKANGGQLFTNGVTMIGNGGTHEQNPMEGVPMGIDPNGIPNLVEEGEVIFNDYVFSNRLNVPNAVREKYKLRGNKELTFADAAKQMQKESEERPNDPISKRGLESAMLRLQQAQETVREEKQASQEGRQYAHGGKMGILYAGTGPYPNFLGEDEYDEDNFLGYTKRGILTDDGDIISFTSPDIVSAQSKSTTVPSKETGSRSTGSGSNGNKRNLSWLRYAPVVGAAIGLGQNLLSRPDYSSPNAVLAAAERAGTYTPVRYSPVGNYLTYTPFDRDYYINKLNADTAASRRGLVNTSGGNRAAAMAGILASDYNYGNQLGALARQAEEYNLAQRQAVETFNRATNMANAEMGLKAAMANQEAALNAGKTRLSGTAQAMAMRDEIAARRGAGMSANLTNFFNSLGDIGREEYSRNMIMSNPALYYSIDSKGNVTYKNGYEDLSEAEKKEVRTSASKAKSKKAKGGYLTIKKGGRHG